MLPMRPLRTLLNATYTTQNQRLLYSLTAVTGIGSAIFATRAYSSSNFSKDAKHNLKPSSYATMAHKAYNITPYTPPPNLTSSSINAKDFTRQDESTDTDFYAQPRFVTHIDDNAIAALRTYYGFVLPTGTSTSNAKAPRILDLCTSWISHYPDSLSDAASKGAVRIVGLGMNKPELDRNKLLDSGGRVLRDLNANPKLDAQILLLSSSDISSATTADLPENQKLDATTCTVSIDYLTQPVRVLSSLRSLTKTGGMVHLAISNRCFPTKAVRRWMYADEQERLRLCCADLWRAGWRSVEVVEVTDGSAEGEEGGEAEKAGFKGLMAMMGMRGGSDPLWVVRGTNPGGTDDTAGESRV